MAGEQVEPYEETLEIHVRSAYEPAARTQMLKVMLTVQASTERAVWGRVEGGMLCTQIAPTTLRVSAFEQHTTPFTACDSDNLPVNHQLPSPIDARRFSARMDAANGGNEVMSTEYQGQGIYNLPFTVPAHGAFAFQLQLSGLDVGWLDGDAMCAADRVPLPGGRCGCRAGFFQPSEAEPCEPCTTVRTSSFEGAIGAAECDDACSHGYFWPSLSSNPWDEPLSKLECTLCTVVLGTSCRLNATLATLNLTESYWRHSNATNQTWACIVSGGWSPCRGGVDAGHEGDGYCAPGYRGPRCEMCMSAGSSDGPALTARYFDKQDAKCHDCRGATTQAFIVLCVVLAVLLALVGGGVVLLRHEQSRRARHAVTKKLRTLLKLWRLAGMRCKVKILVGLYQCVSAIPSVYDVTTPPGLKEYARCAAWHVRCDVLLPSI